MKQQKNQLIKSTFQRTFEFALLCCCLFVMALRAMYTESTNTSSIFEQGLSNQALSLIISSFLIVTFAAWLIFSFISGTFRYRFNWIEIGALLFIVAGAIGVSIASEKRMAITDCVTIAAPMLMAILLVQLLDSDTKIKLVLMIIVACGATATYKCVDQHFSSNQMMIDQYEEAPSTQLSRLNINPQSFRHFLYEHRLYSRDVPAFFTTGNSAGSFMLMAIFAAIALFWNRYKDNPAGFLVAAALTATVIFGLYLTHSKGATAAIMVSAAMLSCYVLFGNFLKRFKIPIIVACVLLATVGVIATVKYGLDHGRLPGGNSMLVRWQYWVGAIKIYALKPFTGVGGGNFASYYTHFKEAGALETVKDPHNFLLSILSQYGPLGLIGIMSAFVMPMLKNVFSGTAVNTIPQEQSANINQKLITAGISIVTALLILRPVFLKSETTSSPAEFIFMVVYLYIMPLVVFSIAWLLMALRETKYCINSPLSGKTAAIIFCGIAGVICHNLIDFAYFEPGVSTAFWALTACMIAYRLNKTQTDRTPLNISKPLRIAGVCIAGVFVLAFFNIAVIPPLTASKLQADSLQDFAKIHEKLDLSAMADTVSPDPVNFHGRIYLQQFDETSKRYPQLLNKAAECFIEAANRDKANFNNYEKLGQTYNLLADSSTGQLAKGYRQKALQSFDQAIERYPNSDRLHIKAAQTADALNDKDKALKHYNRVIEIENAYREIFKVMYPEREVFSRLGEEKYQHAKKRVEQLISK